MDKIIKLTPAILIFFHAIGIGIFVYLDAAPDLSFITILLSAVVVLALEKKPKSAIIPFSVVFIVGYLIELIGVQTGLLFGEYIYHPPMGPTLFGTPIIIGATWYGVIAGAATIASYVKGSKFGQSIIAGGLAVLMDLLIEQVAVHYGLWDWKIGEIPLYNYVCWYIFGAIFAFVYLQFQEEKNKTAFWLFWIWIGFFAILTLYR